jgi:predicted nucleic acid-binding Zn finger protein
MLLIMNYLLMHALASILSLLQIWLILCQDNTTVLDHGYPVCSHMIFAPDGNVDVGAVQGLILK